MTYSAATALTASAVGITLTDAALTVQDTYYLGGNAAFDRFEVKMEGGRAMFYRNGALSHTGEVLTQNPSYVMYSLTDYDDIIYGSTESEYIFSMPEYGYFLMKDFLNPAASGFYRGNTTNSTGPPVLISSYNMTTTFGKGSDDNETLVLNDYGGGNYQTIYTGSRYAGYTYWDLASFFADSNAAPYGLYIVTIPGTVEYSNTIPYIGSGATLTFDKTSYGVGETATIDVVISDGYYDTDEYYYHVKIQDLWATELSDQPITFSGFSPYEGQVTYDWESDTDAGMYYGLVYAKRLSDSEEIIMNYDNCEVTTNVVVNGFVFDAQTESVLPNVTVSVTQGSTTASNVSLASGNYSTLTTSFFTDAVTTISANKTGYENYTTSFTPLVAGTLDLNITLVPTNPTYSGVALGGVVRTPPYNRTVPGATIIVTNGSTSYTATSNSVGFYTVNNMSGNLWYNIVGTKYAYTNSSTYQKLVVGS
jgi:hypothetical protein